MTTDVTSTLTSALGINTGIDTTSLVASLVSATYQPKLDLLNSRLSTANSQISALASAKSSLDTFSSALTSLLQSKDYSGQPASSDPTTVSVTPVPGATPTTLPATVEVDQLAQGQVLTSGVIGTDSTAVAGTGSLNLAVGSNNYTITLGSTNNTLQDLADAINAAKTGVTAAITSDKNGAKLVLKGATGVDNSFQITANGDADTNLQRFVYTGAVDSNNVPTDPMSQTQAAQDAIIKVDGATMQFTSNTVTTAIPNLSLELNKASVGTTVTIATDQPTSTMSDLVGQIVSAYNTLKSALNTATRTSDGTSSTSSGLLTNDSGVRQLVNNLSQLSSTSLNPDGTYHTLSDIGVSTNNDGTLSLDQNKLDAALAADPAGVVQMLNPTTTDSTHIGIAGALSTIVTNWEQTDGPLSASQNTYQNLATDLQKQIDQVNTDETNYSTNLTNQYAAMQTTLLQLKATQSYITQQVAVWSNKSG